MLRVCLTPQGICRYVLASIMRPHHPASVVQRQLEAYNAHDIDALLATYADEAEQFEHPATLLACGAGEIRTRMHIRFTEPNLRATLLNRIVMGTFVVDHERVMRTFPEGPSTQELVAIYEVKEGRIAKAWFLPGPRSPLPGP